MMIVIRVEVSRKHARDIKIKDVIGLTPDGIQHKLRILNAYLDTKGQPIIKTARRRAVR